MFMATVMGGSVVIFLAATPFIYNEDFAWSVPLTIGSLFAMIGVMERPTWGRVSASVVLVLCANLDRTPTGYACVIGALLIAGWLALGLGGQTNRRWALPMVAVGVVPFAASCAVTYAKFGIPVGLPMADQVWAAVNAHRRYFLAANGGKAFSFKFLPSTLWRLPPPARHSLFAECSPSSPRPVRRPPWLGGAVMDQTYPTASLTATSPLLLLLSIWGTVTAFRPKALGQIRLARIILVAAAAGHAGVLLWGYISQRYIADLMPFVIVGACHRASSTSGADFEPDPAGPGLRAGRSVGGCRLLRRGQHGHLALAGLGWTLGQAAQLRLRRERAQHRRRWPTTVSTGPTLPYWAPAGQLFIVNHCSGLYLSTGNDLKNVPGQQIQHLTWLPVEQSASITHTIGYTFNRPASHLTGPVTLLTYGSAKLVIQPSPANRSSSTWSSRTRAPPSPGRRHRRATSRSPTCTPTRS